MGSLLITVRSLTGVYHGRADADAPEWPPSPFRLFQALVAGACGGRWKTLDEGRDEALRWLERQAPPEIHAPPVRRRHPYLLYVPNNDLDAKGGDPARTEEIRTGKTLRPLAFDPGLPIRYLWRDLIDEVPPPLGSLVERLHTFGLGIDPAFAELTVLADAEPSVEPAYPLVRHVPGPRGGAGGGRGLELRIAIDGSLDSLHARHDAFSDRFTTVTPKKTLFRQPPKPLSDRARYDAPTGRLLLELRRADAPDRFVPVASLAAAGCVAALQGRVAERFPSSRDVVERLVMGIGADRDDLDRRVRFMPLPSIGGDHADGLIRRVLVEVPPRSPVRLDALRWALEGERFGPTLIVVASPADRMVARYAPSRGARRWRTVTPVVLPEPWLPAPPDHDERGDAGTDGRSPRDRARAGIDGRNRSRADARAGRAVRAALRHAGVVARTSIVRCQREPFVAHGPLAPAYARGTRFEASRMAHVELAFERPVDGPLLVGNGRFAGLGLFAPVSAEPTSAWAFRLSGGVCASRREALLRQVRRAVMARVQGELGGERSLPPFVTGHGSDGAPLRDGTHAHLYYRTHARDGTVEAFEILLPDIVNRDARRASESRGGVRERRLIGQAVADMTELHFEGDTFALERIEPDVGRAALGFRTAARYLSTHRPRRGEARDPFVERDVTRQIERVGLPAPESVRVSSATLHADGRLSATIEVSFARAIAEPVLLGRDAHFGGGDFRALEPHDGSAGP